MSSLVGPSLIKPKWEKNGGLLEAQKATLSLSTILLTGATFQVLLFLLPLRPIYTLLPAVFFLLLRITRTLLITYHVLPNHYMNGVITRKVTAQVPNHDGHYTGPGQEKIAVLLLSAKSNHPLGLFAPDFKAVGEFLTAMSDELERDPTQETGCLGMTAFNRKDATTGAIQLLYLSYWRSLADVHAYAHAPTHAAAWKWFESKVSGKNNCVGIMHELFEAPAGCWESVYQNFAPTMLGHTTYLRKGGKMVGGEVREQWVSPLLENKGVLRTSDGRRGLKEEH